VHKWLDPTPRVQLAEPRSIPPDEPRAVDFVARAQVNINPQLSDHLGFARISSGVSRTVS
jgi:peptide chain release factor 3